MKTLLEPSENLSRRIQSLEADIRQQQQIVQGSMDELIESLQPRNLIRSALHSVVSNPDTRNKALKAGAGFIGGALLKKFVPRAVGAVVSMVITRIRNNKSKKHQWKL